MGLRTCCKYIRYRCIFRLVALGQQWLNMQSLNQMVFVMMSSEVYSLDHQLFAVCNANEEKLQWQCTANHSMRNGQQVSTTTNASLRPSCNCTMWYNMLSCRFFPSGILQLLSVLAHVPQ
ncbi:TPA: hypothetical protein ACH3X2_013844 [Trebouxia sp. C0005]